MIQEELQEYVDIMKAIMKMPESSIVYRNVKLLLAKEFLAEFISEFEDRKLTYSGYIDSCISIRDYKAAFDKIVNEQKEKS